MSALALVSLACVFVIVISVAFVLYLIHIAPLGIEIPGKGFYRISEGKEHERKD